MYKELNKDSFRNEVINNKNLAVVQFKKDWNGACQILEPIYLDLAKSFDGKVDFFDVDLERIQSLELEYRITELPTILFFDRGQLIDYSMGLASKELLSKKIERALAHHNAIDN